MANGQQTVVRDLEDVAWRLFTGPLLWEYVCIGVLVVLDLHVEHRVPPGDGLQALNTDSCDRQRAPGCVHTI